VGAPKAQIVVLISSSDKSNFSVLFPNYPVLQVNSQLRSTVRVSTSLNYPPSETGGYPPASRTGSAVLVSASFQIFSRRRNLRGFCWRYTVILSRIYVVALIRKRST